MLRPKSLRHHKGRNQDGGFLCPRREWDTTEDEPGQGGHHAGIGHHQQGRGKQQGCQQHVVSPTQPVVYPGHQHRRKRGKKGIGAHHPGGEHRRQPSGLPEGRHIVFRVGGKPDEKYAKGEERIRKASFRLLYLHTAGYHNRRCGGLLRAVGLLSLFLRRFTDQKQNRGQGQAAYRDALHHISAPPAEPFNQQGRHRILQHRAKHGPGNSGGDVLGAVFHKPVAYENAARRGGTPTDGHAAQQSRKPQQINICTHTVQAHMQNKKQRTYGKYGLGAESFQGGSQQ